MMGLVRLFVAAILTFAVLSKKLKATIKRTVIVYLANAWVFFNLQGIGRQKINVISFDITFGLSLFNGFSQNFSKTLVW